MFSFIDYLAGMKHLPVLNIIANGGRITIKEAYHAVQQGRPLVILEGSERATELIIAALDRIPQNELRKLLLKLNIAQDDKHISECLTWLKAIADYDQGQGEVTRFDLLSQEPEEFKQIILSRLT